LHENVDAVAGIGERRHQRVVARQGEGVGEGTGMVVVGAHRHQQLTAQRLQAGAEDASVGVVAVVGSVLAAGVGRPDHRDVLVRSHRQRSGVAAEGARVVRQDGARERSAGAVEPLHVDLGHPRRRALGLVPGDGEGAVAVGRDAIEGGRAAGGGGEEELAGDRRAVLVEQPGVQNAPIHAGAGSRSRLPDHDEAAVGENRDFRRALHVAGADVDLDLRPEHRHDSQGSGGKEQQGGGGQEESDAHAEDSYARARPERCRGKSSRPRRKGRDRLCIIRSLPFGA
jgi:hypothetical protein